MAAEDSLEESPESDSKNEKTTLSYWLKFLTASKKAAQYQVDDARAAWREYENRQTSMSTLYNDTRAGVIIDCPYSYPIYWASCKTIEPAYYSRTPKLTTEREFEYDDPVADLGSIMLERMGRYHLRMGGFDEVMIAAVQDFIHADKATTQTIVDIDESQDRVELTDAGDAKYVDANGQQYPGEVFKDENGKFFGNAPQVKKVKINLAPCCFDEVLHTPNAKVQAEIREIAYRFMMGEEEARKRFPNIPDLPFKMGTALNDKLKNQPVDNSDKTEPIGKYLEGWEIWCKDTMHVYWVCEEYPHGFLDKKDDPLGLPNFFPSPAFIIGSKPSKNLYPTPIFVQLQPTIQQLHQSYGKIFNLIQAIRRRAIVDGASPELIEALNNLSDNEFIAHKSIADIVNKGGLENMIYYLPVQELVAAIGELTTLESQFADNFNEWFGMPDVLRGVSDPVETAASQEIKVTAAHDRFKYAKKQIKQLARDSLELMIDLSLRLWDDNFIAKVTGYQFMPPDEQQLFPQALAMIKDNEERLIRIDIETDSLSFIDQALRQQQRAQVQQMISQGLHEVSSTVQIDPAIARVSLQILVCSLEGMEGGKEFIDGVKKAGQSLIDAIENPPEMPPAPDYELLKLQNEQRRIALDEHTQLFEEKKFEIEQQYKQISETMETETKNALDQAKIGLQAQEVEISGLKVQTEAQQKASQQALKEVELTLQKQLDDAVFGLEQFKAVASVQQQNAEEARLKDEQTLDAMRLMHEQITTHLNLKNPMKPKVVTPILKYHRLTRTADGYDVETVDKNTKKPIGKSKFVRTADGFELHST